MAINWQDYNVEDLEQFGALLDSNGILYQKLKGKTQSNGVYEFYQPFLCRFSGLFTPALSGEYLIPAYLYPHPFLPWALAVESDWEQLNGDWALVTTLYRGCLSTGIPVQRDKSTSTTEPIYTHPRFADIVAWIEAQEGFTGQPFLVDIDSNGQTTFKAFGQNAGRYKGVESYEAGGATHSYSYNSNNPSDRWDVLKMIDTPKGNPPEIPSGAGWILDDIQQEIAGNFYAITETWKSTGPIGADPIIYG